jgi:signal transduction histidine kinase
VRQLIEDGLKLWRLRLANDGIQLRLSLRENLHEVLGDPIEIHQVLTNLIQNALEAMEQEGTLSISVENGTLSFDKKRPAVIIKVQDSGPGIPFDQQRNIFNPFFTTKHTGNGVGADHLAPDRCPPRRVHLIRERPGCGNDICR